MAFEMTMKEEIAKINREAAAISTIRQQMKSELACSCGCCPSVVDYRNKSNQWLQDLCYDIDFDFMSLNEYSLNLLESMASEKDVIQWLEIVRREREEGA